jgi:hypothetical protein
MVWTHEANTTFQDIKPLNLGPLDDDFHYQKSTKHILSWIALHITR